MLVHLDICTLKMICKIVKEIVIETFFNFPTVLGEDVDTGIGLCGWLLTAISWVIVIFTLPFSLCVCFKVPQPLN